MKRMSPYGARLVACAFMVAVTALASIGSPARAAEDEHRVSDLIVTTPRQPEVLVLEHLTDLDVAGYGVNTIGEFLAALSGSWPSARASSCRYAEHHAKVTLSCVADSCAGSPR
jgi:hypothetical protein